MVLPVYIHYTETNVYLRMCIYGSTNAYLWIYEYAIVDEQTLHHRSNGATPLVEQKTADI